MTEIPFIQFFSFTYYTVSVYYKYNLINGLLVVVQCYLLCDVERELLVRQTVWRSAVVLTGVAGDVVVDAPQDVLLITEIEINIQLSSIWI